jgi:hypothetical protein
MIAKFFLQYLFASLLGIGADDGYATVFGFDGDVHAGGDMACNQRPIPKDQPVCAHRWLPCGTKIVVVNLERPAVSACWVGDRGPYMPDGQGRWRGLIDLTPHAARSVRLDGRDMVLMLYALPKAGHPVYQNASLLAPPKAGRRVGF